jgi:nucleotide-binding universal stress UspA family protein
MRRRFERILCATDLSPYSNRALAYAARLASVFGARLSVCHVVDLHSLGTYMVGKKYTPPVTPEELAAEARAGIQKAMARETVPWEPLILQGEADVEIAGAAERLQADLLVCASHGRSGVKRLVLGSVAERILRTARCPLLVVRGPEEGGFPGVGAEVRLGRILVACDFSPDSRLAVDCGISLAEELQAELHLLHVIERSAYRSLTRATEALTDQLDRAVKSAVEEELRKAVPAEASSWCQVTTALRSGVPGDEIATYAGLHVVDLIVAGTHGRNLLDRLRFGSTVDRLVRSAPCPVLVVRPPLAFSVPGA